MNADVIRLMGGLGNQMFQYAFARRLGHWSSDGRCGLMFKVAFAMTRVGGG